MTKENRKEKLWAILSDEFIKADMARLSSVIDVEFTEKIYKQYTNNLVDMLNDEEFDYVITVGNDPLNLKLMRGEDMTDEEIESLMETVDVLSKGEIITNLTEKTLQVLKDMKFEIKI